MSDDDRNKRIIDAMMQRLRDQNPDTEFEVVHAGSIEVEEDVHAADPTILPEAQVEILTDTAARYAGANPWKPGDIVTIRKDSPRRGAGIPHVILEVRDAGPDLSHSDIMDTGSALFGQRFTVRVACVTKRKGDHYVAAFWMDHWELEEYKLSA